LVKNQVIMKKAILRFGIYSSLGELISFVLCWFILSVWNIGISAQGNLGWAAILCPLVFVYFGVRYYRDAVNNGSITFLEGLKVGLLIMIMPSLFYALIETIYVIYIDPKFYENIGMKELEQYRKTLSPAAFAAKIKEMKLQLTVRNSPVYNFSTIAIFIAACGTIVALLSAVILRRKPKTELAAA
jgi:hypothetical protein